MPRYTTEYKDALYHTAKLYTEGVISTNTLNSIAKDMTRVNGIESRELTVTEVLDDLDALQDVWDKYEVLG